MIFPCCYYNEVVCRSQFADDHHLAPINGIPSHQVLPFPSCPVTLPLHDFSSENRPFQVKYGQRVFIHLIQGMECDNIPALMDSGSEALKDSRVQRIQSRSRSAQPDDQAQPRTSRVAGRPSTGAPCRAAAGLTRFGGRVNGSCPLVLRRRLSSSPMVLTSWLKSRASSSRLLRVSSTIGSFHIVLRLDKLQRCTDRRRNDTELHTLRSDLRLHERIGHVCTVPCQEDIDAIDRSQTYVQSVECSLLGQRLGGEQRICRSFGLLGRRKDREPSEKHLPLGGSGRITGCALCNDDF